MSYLRDCDSPLLEAVVCLCARDHVSTVYVLRTELYGRGSLEKVMIYVHPCSLVALTVYHIDITCTTLSTMGSLFCSFSSVKL